MVRTKRQVEQLAGASKQNKETTNKTSGEAKQMKQGVLGC